MIKLWINDTSAGSLFNDNAMMKHVPRIDEILSVSGYRYRVEQIIHEQRNGRWIIHIILAELGKS